jgi:hypothetical protein
MPLRRSARLLAAGALVLAAPALTSCGFDYATDRVYTPGAGTNDRSQDVDVLGAVLVSAERGSGTLVATFVNNDNEEDATVTAIEGAGDDAELTVEGFSTITVPANGLVNLADAEIPINISGDFDSGAFLTLQFTFGDGSTVEQAVPTVPDCWEYAGLDASAETPTAAEECEPAPPVGEVESAEH